jgi:hypothetical protein
MIYDNFKINASPFFHDVLCPKHRSNMIEVPYGFMGLSKAWYCERCKRVYELKLVMMNEKKVNKEVLNDILKEHYEKPNK